VITVIHPRLVLIEGLRFDCYVSLQRHGWCDDKSGRAVCPVTRERIAAAIRCAQPA